MIGKDRIKKQGNRVLAINPFDALVAAVVTGFDEDGTPLVKFPCMFNPKRVPFEDLFEFPVPEEIDYKIEQSDSEDCKEEVTPDES